MKFTEAMNCICSTGSICCDLTWFFSHTLHFWVVIHKLLMVNVNITIWT